MIESKVNALSYEGFDNIQTSCNERGIPLQVPNGRQAEIIELIATRNLIAHNRCVVDERYVRMVRGTTRKVGETRTLGFGDLENCMEMLGATVAATDKAVAGKYRIRRKALSPKLSSETPNPQPDDDAKSVGAGETKH